MDLRKALAARRRSASSRYGAAVAAVLAAVAVRFLLDRFVETGSPFLLLPLAILVGAWYGGLGPGLAATGLATVLALELFLVPPLNPASIALRAGLFVAQGVGISLIAHSLQRAKRQAEDDAARARSASRELRKRDDQLTLITDSLPVLISYLDRELRYRFVNRTYEAWTGHPRDEILGRTLREIAGEKAYAAARPAVEEALAGRQATYEARVDFERGPSRDLEGTYIPHVGEDGAVQGFFALVADVSERRRHADQLQALYEEAQEARAEAVAANRLKDQFLATLSHELRTPLSAIVGWSSLLRTGRLGPAEAERAVEAIDRNARAQAQLIEDLLDVSRVISGKLDLDLQIVGPAEVVEAAVATVSPAAGAKGVRIVTELDPRAGPVLGDPHRLQQVVWNLLANAVKFTPEGGRVQVRLSRAGEQVEIEVADSGQGITPEFLPHVFDLFRQADPSSTRRHGGLGLGLAIVRQLVERHGGGIEARSDGAGRGATFSVRLPVARGAESRPDVASAPAADPVSLAGMRVLVVDDEPDARELLARVLQDRGAEVSVAGSADQAIAALGRSRPDVLVSDLGMPERDGFDLIREVRGGHSAKEVPAVALTAFAHPEDRRRALLAGFQVHLSKPFDPEELAAVVAGLAGRTGTPAGVPTPH